MVFEVKTWTIQQSDSDTGCPVIQDLPINEVDRWWTEPRSPCKTGTTWTIEFLLVTAEDYRFNSSEMRAELETVAKSLPLDAFMARDTVIFNVRFGKDSSGDFDEMEPGPPFYSIGDQRFGICWTWDPLTHVTKGWVLGCTGTGAEKLQMLVDRLPKCRSYRTDPLLPGLLTLELEVEKFEREIRIEVNQLQDVQFETGYHNYNADPDRPENADSDLGSLSRRTCALAIDISTSALCSKRIVQMASWILEEHDQIIPAANASMNFDQEVLPSLELSASRVNAQLQHWKRKAEANQDMAECWKHNATIIVQTIYTLTAQRDQQVGIQLASDSKTLAEKATRDSTSMKAIAAVTMFFLPGTFVASLFAMPMFDWNAPVNKTLSHRFWIYWAVTIPLTVVVIVCWIFWANRHELLRRFKARTEAANEKRKDNTDRLRSTISRHFPHLEKAVETKV